MAAVTWVDFIRLLMFLTCSLEQVMVHAEGVMVKEKAKT